jgi:YihY family inner membrane protein
MGRFSQQDLNLRMKEKITKFIAFTPLLLKESCRTFLKNSNFEMSAALSSYGFFSLIPLLFFVAYVLGNYATSSQTAMKGVESLATHMFPELNSFISHEIGFMTTYKPVWGAIGLIMLLVSIIPFTDTLRTAFAQVFRTNRPVSFLRAQVHNIIAVFVILALSVTLVLFEAVYSIIVEKVLEGAPSLLASIDFGISLAIVVVFVLVFYLTFLPGKVKGPYLLAGSFVTAILLILFRKVFSWFLAFNPEYGIAFGSLKTVFAIMGWVYCSFMVMLFGAEVIVNVAKKDALLLRGLFLGSTPIPAGSYRLMKKFLRSYDAGKVIFEEGEQGDSMFYILSGSVKICKGDHVVRVLKGAGYFGEMSMLLDVPRTATVVAAENDTQLVGISRRNFELILSENPAIVLAILKEMAWRVKITTGEQAL